MIELTPIEVEACRKLKAYTEKKLAEELYAAIVDNKDEEMIEYMSIARDHCRTALKYLDEVFKILEIIKFEFKNKKEIDKIVKAILKKASPLAMSYIIHPDKKDKLIKKIKEGKGFIPYRDEKIADYKQKILKLEKFNSNLNGKYNTLIYQLSTEDCKKNHLDDVINILNDIKLKDIDSKLIALEEIVKKFNEHLDKVKSNNSDKSDKDIIIKQTTNEYFNVKKRLDLDIIEYYNKINWQTDYADGLARIATFDNCTDLEYGDLKILISNTYNFDLSDCSDTFRLFGKVNQILHDKLTPKHMDEIAKKYTKKEITVEQFKLITQLRGSYREISYLKASDVFIDIPKDGNGKQLLSLPLPEKYIIDKGEAFIKYCESCNLIQENITIKKIKKIWYVCDTNKCGHTEIEKIRRKNDKNCPYCLKGKLTISKETEDEYQVCEKCNFELTDHIKQKLECVDCGEMKTKSFAPGKHITETSIIDSCPNLDCKSKNGKKNWCPKCKKRVADNEIMVPHYDVDIIFHKECTSIASSNNEELIFPATFKPLGTNPFYQGKINALRSRTRDSAWSAGFILKHNSVVRTIDRTFGLPECADISGTTADTLFGIEVTLRLINRNLITTLGKELVSIPSKVVSNFNANRAPLFLLPLITMTKHGHHAILECGLTYTLTGYINNYQIGKYSSLWPGSTNFLRLKSILEKWEKATTNLQLIIDRDKDGFVEKGYLLDGDKTIPYDDKDKNNGYTFKDISKLNYQTYVDIFLPLRDKMINNEAVNKDLIAKMMQDRSVAYSDLVKESLTKFKNSHNDPDYKTKVAFNEYADNHDAGLRYDNIIDDNRI